MDYSLIIPFLTAFGLGSIVTTIVQFWLQTRLKKSERNFAEKKEAYLGLLEAYHKAAIEPSDANSKNFAFWQMRCELVAPKKVRDAISDIVASNDHQGDRFIAHEKLKDELRADLRVIKK